MNLKNEKGAVTLFVLVSCLFFLTSVACVNMYLQSKLSAVNKEYKQIKANYESNLENINAINKTVSFGKCIKNYETNQLTLPVALNTSNCPDNIIKYVWIYNSSDLSLTYPNTDELNTYLTNHISQNQAWTYVEKNENSVFSFNATHSCAPKGYYYLCVQIGNDTYWNTRIASFDVKLRIDNEIVEISPNDDLSKIYGKTVTNYTTGGTYRIFYIDFDGDFGDFGTIYLKADYDESNSTSLSSSISYNPISTDILEKMNTIWAEDRLQYKDSTDNDTKWNENEHCAAYLCDPTTLSNTSNQAWVNFFDSSKANYVIGSPSAIMYTASYNQVHHTIGDNIINPIYLTTLTDPAYGYEFYLDNSSAIKSYTGTDTLDYATDYGNMYCGIGGSKLGDWCLSSPSAAAPESICYVRGERASLNDGHYEDPYIICPLVSLKPSFVPQIEDTPIEVQIQIGSTSTTLTKSSNLNDIYGQIVTNYAKNGDTNTYRIFYIDFDGKFGPKGTIYLKADYNTANNINLDSLDADIYSPINTSILEKMNSAWWEARGTSQSSWNINEHSVAYLCDPTTASASSNQAWINFFNSQNADYVIGSPSLEMLMKSHKQVSHTTGSNSLSSSYRATNAPGYIYHDGSGNSKYDYYTKGTAIDNLGYSNMYSSADYDYYWIASPSSSSTSSICNLGHGSLDNDTPDSNLPVCPVVALKTSFVPIILPLGT